MSSGFVHCMMRANSSAILLLWLAACSGENIGIDAPPPLTKDERVHMQYLNGEKAYRAGNYVDALHYFSQVLEEDRDHVMAILGFANASRERGNQVYREAHLKIRQGERREANELMKTGQNLHVSALQALNKLLERGKDFTVDEKRQVDYSIGQLYYERLIVFATLDLPIEENPQKARRLIDDMAAEAVKRFLEAYHEDASLEIVKKYLGVLYMYLEKVDDAKRYLQSYLLSIQQAEQRHREAAFRFHVEDPERAKQSEQAALMLKQEASDIATLLKKTP